MADKKQIYRYMFHAATLAVSILILRFLFARTDIKSTLMALKRTGPWILLACTSISLVSNMLLRPYIWKKILDVMGCSITLAEAVFIRLGSFPLVSLLPLKSGEISKAVYLVKEKGYPMLSGAYSIIFEYAMSILALLFMIGAGLFWAGSRNGESFSLLLGAFWMVLLIWSFLRIESITGLFLKLFRKRGADGSHGQVADRIFSLKEKAVLFFLSAVFFVHNLIIFHILFYNYGVDAGLDYTVVFVPLIILIGKLPFTVYGIGARETAFVLFFSRFAPYDTLLSIAVLVTLLDYMIPIFFGAFFMKFFLDRIIIRRPG